MYFINNYFALHFHSGSAAVFSHANWRALAAISLRLVLIRKAFPGVLAMDAPQTRRNTEVFLRGRIQLCWLRHTQGRSS